MVPLKATEPVLVTEPSTAGALLLSKISEPLLTMPPVTRGLIEFLNRLSVPELTTSLLITPRWNHVPVLVTGPSTYMSLRKPTLPALVTPPEMVAPVTLLVRLPPAPTTISVAVSLLPRKLTVPPLMVTPPVIVALPLIVKLPAVCRRLLLTVPPKLMRPWFTTDGLIKPLPLIVPVLALVIVPPLTVPVGALVSVPALVQSVAMFKTPLLAALAVPFCTGKPVTVNVPLLAINAPPLEAIVEMEPKPMRVPAAAFVRLPPVRLPPWRLTVLVLLHAGTTLSVASDSRLTIPFCTGAVVTLRVPLVTMMVPEFTTRLESVPKPIKSPAALLVRLLPTMKPPASWTVPLLAQLVLAVSVWLLTLSVPLISGATLLMIRPPEPPSDSVPEVAIVKPPTTLATAPVTVVEPEIVMRLVAALLRMSWAIVALPARVPALVALILVAISAPVNPSGPLMLRKLLPVPPSNTMLSPCDAPANVSVPTPEPAPPVMVIVLKVTLLLNCRLRKALPRVPAKLIWPTPLVKNATPLKITEALPAWLPVAILVKLRLSATKLV